MSQVQILATTNLVIQLSLVTLLSVAVFLVKRRRALGRHCALMRRGVPVQMAAIAAIMLPSMLGYIRHEHPPALFRAEMFTHHSLGLVMVAMWVYIILVFNGRVATRGRLVVFMRIAFTSWVASLAIGLHLYFQIWYS